MKNTLRFNLKGVVIPGVGKIKDMNIELSGEMEKEEYSQFIVFMTRLFEPLNEIFKEALKGIKLS